MNVLQEITFQGIYQQRDRISIFQFESTLSKQEADSHE
jgi:hypothetical protein